MQKEDYMNSSKVSILQDNRFKVFFAVFVMVGWSLAYPLIKLGYQEFQIDGRDLGGKILFAGVRFFMAGTAVTLYCHFKKIKTDISDQGDIAWLVLLGIVNTALHYMFAYIGLGYNSSARSTILDSMGGFILIILSTIIFPDDKMTWRKAIGCILGVAGIVSINIQPGVDFFENITFMGDGMILLNACCTALGGLITRVVSRRMNITRAGCLHPSLPYRYFRGLLRDLQCAALLPSDQPDRDLQLSDPGPGRDLRSPSAA